ncbi:alcohol oxidase [Aspergillus crustosus]
MTTLHPKAEPEPEADYIIIGGGTAGLVLAARLSEPITPSSITPPPPPKIIVLEAGPDLTTDPRIQIPALWTTLMGSDADWNFATTPQPGLRGREVRIPQGRLLGGSSGVNGLTFVAPGPGAVDSWDLLNGPELETESVTATDTEEGDGKKWEKGPRSRTRWDWESLKLYYRKSFTIQVPDPETQRHIGVEWVGADGYDKGSGPLKASFPATKENPVAKAWVETFQNIGFGAEGDPFSAVGSGSGSSSSSARGLQNKGADDANGARLLGGYSNLALTDEETKTRSFAASAYGVAARERGVDIITGAVVRRVLFEVFPGPDGQADGEPVATGVEVAIEGRTHVLRAKKEVLLCAGAINTPKILELSGIGNAELLRNLDIPVLVDNPNVGENLQDHLSTGISFEAVDSVVTLDPLLRQEPEAIQAAMQQYTESKSGPMTIGGIQSSAFMPILEFHSSNKERVSTLAEFIDPFLFLQPDQSAAEPEPDARNTAIRNILTKPNSPSSMMFMFLGQGNLHDHKETAFSGSSLKPGNIITLGFETNFSFSRGNTHITSSDPGGKPTINPNYFKHPLDLELMARTLLDVHGLHKLSPLSEFLKKDGQRNHPDAFLTDIASAKKYLLDTVNTTYHYCGTAAMLPRDKGGVVGTDLRVHGVKGLRVVDASVFPVIPAANIQSSVYAVAERAADVIKGVV